MTTIRSALRSVEKRWAMMIVVRPWRISSIVCWIDDNFEQEGVRAQRFDPAGHRLWGDSGVPVSGSGISVTKYDAIPDGAGGFLTAWVILGNTCLFTQRIGPDGQKLWPEEGGIPVADLSSGVADLGIVPAAPGEMIIAWRDSASLIWMTRITGPGLFPWYITAHTPPSGTIGYLEMEPDGIPNKLNTPLSSTQFNCWYHLGLGYYLLGKYQEAASAYKECLKWSNNNDLKVATTDWLYMTYRRLGKKEEAQALLTGIEEDWELVENSSYYNRLLMYKGLKTPDSLLTPGEGTEYEKNLNLATQGYGVGNWYFYNGDLGKALSTYKQVLEGKSWSAFGYIAAEVDLFNHLNVKKE